MASKYYYNNNILPGLPNTEGYSNHYIVYNVYGDHGYRLYETDIAAYYSSSDEVTFPTGTKAVIWNTTAEDDEWRDRTDFVVGDTVLSNEVILMWTHYDIFHEDGTTVYKKGSEPVPVTEPSPSVPEWTKMRGFIRGILAGLVSNGYLGSRTGKMPPTYITFASETKFNISKPYNSKTWDSALYYSTDTETWNEWDGTVAIESAEHEGEHRLYMRGVGNTKVGGSSAGRFVMSGSNIRCSGNIENLLDYETVARGEHPPLAASQAFGFLFYQCTALVSAPELPSPVLEERCYYYMFGYCENLVEAPRLPATMLADRCYMLMFSKCSSLKTVPKLPATTLAEHCYDSMFKSCTSIEMAPELPATILTDSCYKTMFNDCTSLKAAPELPATTLADSCYRYMFYNCPFEKAPALPATTMYDFCYYAMFAGCANLKEAPKLPATTLAMYCYYDMFASCTGLKEAPELPATTLAIHCYNGMFSRCTSIEAAPRLQATEMKNLCYNSMFYGCINLATIPALPATVLADSCYKSMFNGCKKVKLSADRTEEYHTEYRIQTNNTGATATTSMQDMFKDTGGTFTGTPEINTTYYTSNAVV